MKKLAFLFALALFSLQALGQTQVERITSDSLSSQFIDYNLPRTTLKVCVVATCTQNIPGPFMNYATRYLNSETLITTPSTTWTLSSVQVIPLTIPDPDAHYRVAINNKTTAYNLQKTAQNILLGVNLPLASCDAKTEAHNAFSPFNSTPAETLEQTSSQEQTPTQEEAFDLHVLGEDALITNSVPKMAEMAAKQIYQIRESRSAIMQGEIEGLNGLAIQTMLDHLDQQEAKLVALFEGESLVSTQTRTYTLNPQTTVNHDVLFRLSTITGLTSADDLLGSPIYYSLKGDNLKRKQDEANDKNRVARQALKKNKRPKQERKGIYYRKPGQGTLTLSDSNGYQQSFSLLLPQFGLEANLSAALFDTKAGRTTVKLHPQTGDLLYINTKK